MQPLEGFTGSWRKIHADMMRSRDNISDIRLAKIHWEFFLFIFPVICESSVFYKIMTQDVRLMYKKYDHILYLFINPHQQLLPSTHKPMVLILVWTQSHTVIRRVSPPCMSFLFPLFLHRGSDSNSSVSGHETYCMSHKFKGISQALKKKKYLRQYTVPRRPEIRQTAGRVHKLYAGDLD